MTRACREVWFFTFERAELLDLVGPWEVLSHANDLAGQRIYDMKLFSARGREVQTRHGLHVGACRSLQAASRAPLPHTLIVAGGGVPSSPITPDEAAFLRWLGRRQRDLSRIVSICTGAFLLGEAGLLDGLEATTHWRFTSELSRRFPLVRVNDDALFVRDGRVWSSAGITAGVDLTLALLEQDHGHALAMSVARELLLFLRRSGRQAQFSPILEQQREAPPALAELHAFVQTHLREALPNERLAARLGMSPRSLSRWARSELGESPAALVRRLRLEEARRLLVATELPLAAVAEHTGLGDPSTLWRQFVRHLGVTPDHYRRRFGPRSRASGHRSA